MHRRQWLVVSLALLVGLSAEAQRRPGKGEPPRSGAGVEVRTLKNGQELEKVRTQGVTDAELRKAKNITVANFWRGMETNSSKAYLLGLYEVFHGDWRKLFDAPARYEQVTREQIRKVALRILDPDRRTVGVLVPTEEAQAPAAQETGR
jgi:zinc protease